MSHTEMMMHSRAQEVILNHLCANGEEQPKIGVIEHFGQILTDALLRGVDPEPKRFKGLVSVLRLQRTAHLHLPEVFAPGPLQMQLVAVYQKTDKKAVRELYKRRIAEVEVLQPTVNRGVVYRLLVVKFNFCSRSPPGNITISDCSDLYIAEF